MSQVMARIQEIIVNFNTEIIFGLGIGLIVLLILNIVLMVIISNTKKNYNALVNGVEDVNIEELLIKTGEDLRGIESSIVDINKLIEGIETRLTFAIQKVGFVRYNAFDDVGSKLSFSIALLDNFKNGFVITGIYGRESTTCYAKAIEQGKSEHPLSTEEERAIARAIMGEVDEKTL